MVRFQGRAAVKIMTEKSHISHAQQPRREQSREMAFLVQAIPRKQNHIHYLQRTQRRWVFYARKLATVFLLHVQAINITRGFSVYTHTHTHTHTHTDIHACTQAGAPLTAGTSHRFLLGLFLKLVLEGFFCKVF
jgi:hypothetical protein